MSLRSRILLTHLCPLPVGVAGIYQAPGHCCWRNLLLKAAPSVGKSQLLWCRGSISTPEFFMEVTPGKLYGALRTAACGKARKHFSEEDSR